MNRRRLFAAIRKREEDSSDQRFNNYTFNDGVVYAPAYINSQESEYMKYLPIGWGMYGGTYNIPYSQAPIYDWGSNWAEYTTGGRYCSIIRLSRYIKRTNQFLFLVQNVNFYDVNYLTFNTFQSIESDATTTARVCVDFAGARTYLDIPTVVVDSVEGEALPKGVFGEMLFDLSTVSGLTEDENEKRFAIGFVESSVESSTVLTTDALWIDNFRLWTTSEMPILNPSFEVGGLSSDGLDQWTLYSQGSPTVTTSLNTDFATEGVRSLRLSQRPTSQSTTIDGWDDYMSMAGISQTVDVTNLRTISWDTRYTAAGVIALAPFAILDGTSIAVSNAPVAGWTTHAIDVSSKTGSLELVIGNGVYNTATAGVGYVTQYDNFLTTLL